MADQQIERVFLPSATRRGRKQVSPTFVAKSPEGQRLGFRRRKDAQQYLSTGCKDPEHDKVARGGWCFRCGAFALDNSRDAKLRDAIERAVRAALAPAKPEAGGQNETGGG